MANKVRYTVALPGSVATVFNTLSSAESMSKPEVLRRALNLYQLVYNTVIKGKNIFVLQMKMEK